MNCEDATKLNTLYLAIIGDAVWQYQIRAVMLPEMFLARAGDIHKIATKYECADFQSELFNVINPQLTEQEKNLAKRARNIHNNNIPKSTTLSNYKRATAAEALIGFWHLTGNTDKINALVNIAKDKGGKITNAD
jgi:ribonuclease-3 family protein